MNMKKGHKFLIGMATAAITFGIWFAALGSGEFNKYGKHRHAQYMKHMHQCEQE